MTASAVDAVADVVAPPSDRRAPTKSGRLTSLVRLLGPTTLLSGLLYYYGYVSLRAYYSYFGINLSVLDLPPDAYVRRGPDTLFKPIGYVTTLLVVLVIAHVLLMHRLTTAKPRSVRRTVLVLGAVAILVGGIGLVVFFTADQAVVPPLCLVAAAGLVEYSVWLLRTCGRPAEPVRLALARTEDLRQGLVVAVVVIGAFWAVDGIARNRGETLAVDTEISLVLQPRAVVYSAKDLQLPGPDVTTSPIAGDESAYAFLSNGLRPLLFSNHRWFLLPAGWRHDNGATVIVIKDDTPGVRVDLAPPYVAPAGSPDG
jgi:hypothetical protein